MQPTPTPENLEQLDHSTLVAMREMYEGNQEMQNLISQYEHQAFTRESTAENPLMAVPYAVAIPGYNVYKHMTGAGRSEPSMGQVVQGYKGIYQGLMQRLRTTSPLVNQFKDRLLKSAGSIIPEASAGDYGSRPDGTPKGKGFFGELKRPDGGISTELTIGTNVDGKDLDIPLLVPSLSLEERNALLKVPEDKKPWDVLPNYNDIERKAIEHARMRMKAGKSVYAD